MVVLDRRLPACLWTGSDGVDGKLSSPWISFAGGVHDVLFGLLRIEVDGVTHRIIEIRPMGCNVNAAEGH
jgi:hypothetical protein